MSLIEADIQQFTNEVSELSAEQGYEALREISNKFTEALKQGEDKVALATQTYNLADQCIQRLDQALLKFETEELVNLKPIKVSLVDPNLKSNDPKTSNPSQNDSDPLAIKRKSYKNPESHKLRHKEGLSSMPADDLYDGLPDMPIDPDEPTYCFCNQVSFGEMVGCDNDSCEKEWFHYQCVGLKTQPKGKWYCADCTAKLKLGNRK